MGKYSELCNDIVDFGNKCSNPRKDTVCKITPHHMAMVCGAKRCAEAHYNREVCSANYYIGNDGEICGGVSEDRRAWTSGTGNAKGSNDHMAITIEVSNSGGAPDWPISDRAYDSLVALCADICKRYNINPHFDGTPNGTITLHCQFQRTACVPDHTELLTPHGWVPMRDINIGDEVASVRMDDLKVSFEKVYNKVQTRRSDVYVNNGLIATKDHRLLYHKQGETQWRIEYYNTLLKYSGNIYIPLAGQAEMPGIPLSDDMIRFYIAVQADGHYMYDVLSDGSRSYYGIEFHLKKERKIERIKEILGSVGLEYNENHKTDGSISIRVYNKDGENIKEDICERYLKDKDFTWEWLNMSKEQARLFLDEIMLWDGCIAGKKYSSAHPINLDIVNAIASINNVGSLVRGKDVIFRDIPYMNFAEKTRRINKQGNKKDTNVTCVSVNTGVILVRQYGKVIVIGNCPGPTLQGKIVSGELERDIKALIEPAPAPTGKSDEEKIWDYLYERIGNAYGVAGLMGNLYAESGLRSNNLQNTYERSLGMTDIQYTAAVDSGAYSKDAFVHDSAGYGLAQWTFWSRKQNLYNAKGSHSIGDLQMQLDYLWEELSMGYKTTLNILKTATSVYQASTAVLTQFERPKDQSEAMKQKRAAYGQVYYDKYAGSSPAPAPQCPYIVRVTCNTLNVRKGPGTNYAITTQVHKGEAYTIMEEQDGWGRLKSGVGWICLQYTQKI